MSRIFLLSWDMNGLESCIDVTGREQQLMWELLSSEDNKSDSVQELAQIVNAIILRARYNPQRHYEVYTVSTDSSITKDDMIEMFNSDPQGSAELIRDRGFKLFSDRLDEKKRVIV
jgi:hypothetical protein